MLRRFAILCAALALSACQNADPKGEGLSEIEQMEQQLVQQHAEWASQQPRPDQKNIDLIEALLEKEPCVGDLKRWSRTYAYNRLPEKTVETSIIDFYLEEAGSYGVRPGVHITYPNAWLGHDDRPIKTAEGDYDLRDGRLRFSHCGNNVGLPSHGSFNNMDSYYEDLKRRRGHES